MHDLYCEVHSIIDSLSVVLSISRHVQNSAIQIAANFRALQVRPKNEDNLKRYSYELSMQARRRHLLALFRRHLFDAVIAVDDAQNVQQLSLVFMDPLHLQTPRSQIKGDRICKGTS